MIVASLPHYADHMAAIAVPDDVALVASYNDLVGVRRHHSRIVLMQHGAGQSYSDTHPAYPGGRDNGAVGLFLVPNDHAAARWLGAYPAARVEVVGSPRLDDLPRRVPGPGPVIAVSTHWDGSGEKASAWPWMRTAIPALAERYEVIGHGHPKRHDMARAWRRMGIEWVPLFDDVCRRADLYICDNSSTLFEFASTGRPVVVVDAPCYRESARHGLRFYDAADVGVRVRLPDGDLAEAVEWALADPPDVAARREAALDIVYAYRTGAAQRAVDTIREWAA